MSRRAWWAFWIVQGVGAVAGEIWPFTMVPSHLISSIGMACWVIDCYLRLPGNVLSAMFIQKYLWMKPIPQLGFGILNLLLTIGLNLLFWLLIAAAYRVIRRFSPRRKMR